MSLIDFADYRTVSDYLAAARDSTVAISTHIFNAVYTIVMLQDVHQEVDMLEDFWDSYLLNYDTFATPSTLLDSVRSLEQHVLKRSSYDDIDAYLTANAGFVSQTFADLSSAAGYPITRTD